MNHSLKSNKMDSHDPKPNCLMRQTVKQSQCEVFFWINFGLFTTVVQMHL